MKKLPFFLITLIVLSACQNDEPETTALTTDEAIASIENTADDVAADIIDLIESDGAYSALSLVELLSVSDGFASNARSAENKSRIQRIASFFAISPAARVSTDENENEFMTGIYEWNASEEDFVFVDESDKLIIKFPVGESESNNGIFTLSELEWTEELPSKIIANITVDDVLMVDVQVIVNWSSNGFPEAADIYVFINPFAFDLNFSVSNTTTKVDFTFTKGDESIAAVHLETAGVFSDEFLAVIEGSIAYRDLKIGGRVDLAGMEEAFDTDGDPNMHMDLTVYVEGQAVGVINLVLETQDEYTDYVPYVVFNDGSTMALEEMVESMLVTIEEELGALEI